MEEYDERNIDRRGYNIEHLLKVTTRIIDDMAMWAIAVDAVEKKEADPGTEETWVDRMWDHAREMLPCKCCGNSDCREDDGRMWLILHLIQQSGASEKRAEGILNSFLFPAESVPAFGEEPWPEAENVDDSDDDEEDVRVSFCGNCECPEDAHDWIGECQSLVCGECGAHCS